VDKGYDCGFVMYFYRHTKSDILSDGKSGKYEICERIITTRCIVILWQTAYTESKIKLPRGELNEMDQEQIY
jgi:hypothetical protein